MEPFQKEVGGFHFFVKEEIVFVQERNLNWNLGEIKGGLCGLVLRGLWEV